jgi:hypothetical protein
MDNTNLVFPSSYSFLTSPTDELSKFGEELSETQTLSDKLKFYNSNIRSLSFNHYQLKLTLLGDRDDFFSGNSSFFDFSKASESERSIFLNQRQKEIEKLKFEIDSLEDYGKKLRVLYNRIGQKSLDQLAWKVYSNRYAVFLFNGGGVIPDDLHDEFYGINLEPIGQEEVRIFNDLIFEYVRDLISDPQQFHWLELHNYPGFLFDKAQILFDQRLKNALNPLDTIDFEIRRIRRTFFEEIGAEENLYPYVLSNNFEFWQRCLFTSFVNGHSYSFERKQFSVNEAMAFIHVEECLKYYKYLIELRDENLLDNNKSFVSKKDSELKQPKNSKNYTDFTWFKIGLQFANGTVQELYRKYKGDAGQFKKITEELGFKKTDRPYISETIQNSTKSDKNIFSNRKKMLKIIDHCHSNAIPVVQDFMDKLPSE